MNKDLFSTQAHDYLNFRPDYPEALYTYIFSKVKCFETAWDCATGNGQVAKILARHFKRVEATDISEAQLKLAVAMENIRYSQAPAEHTTFPDHHFDLITVGQALHWFDLPTFFKEVKRVGKYDAYVATWGYALLWVDPEIDQRFHHYYHSIVGPYWDEARKHIETEYAAIHFPFDVVETAHFTFTVSWSLQQFIGYLRSWSATQQYMRVKKEDPLVDFEKELQILWPHHVYKAVHFPIFLKLCPINKLIIND